MIEFSCHVCGKQIRVRDEAAGQQGKCKVCGEMLLVPRPAELITRKTSAQVAVATPAASQDLPIPAPPVAVQVVTQAAPIQVIAGPIARRWCPTCSVSVVAAKTEPSHLLHFFLSLITFGLWLIIWVLCAVSPQYNCSVCGSTAYGSRFGYWLSIGVRVFIAVVALFAFIGVLAGAEPGL